MVRFLEGIELGSVPMRPLRASRLTAPAGAGGATHSTHRRADPLARRRVAGLGTVLVVGLLLSGCSRRFRHLEHQAQAPPPEGPQPRTWVDERTGARVHAWTEVYGDDGLPLKDGLEERWWPNGQRRAERHWDLGVPVGTWRSWWEDGTLRSTHTYEAGPSTMTFWHPDGELEAHGPHVGGRRHGAWAYFDASGRPVRRGTFHEGTEDGVWTYFHPSGALASRGWYRRGDRVGTWKHWGAAEDVRASDWQPPPLPLEPPIEDEDPAKVESSDPADVPRR